MTSPTINQHTSASRAAEPREERLPGLDGVRGLALLTVVIYHFFIVTAPLSNHWLDRRLTDVIGVGWAAVDLFFVLSGFLITGILVDAKTSSAPFFRTFYARRALRIFPVYYLLLILLLLVLPEIRNLDPQRVANFRDNQWWYWLYATNIHTAADGGQAVDLIETWHLWSLAVEEQFYLVWPALIFLLPRRGMFALCFACIIGAFLLRIAMVAMDVSPTAVHGLTPARIDALAAGGLIALIARSPGGLRSIQPWALPAAMLGLGTCIVLYAARGEFDPFDRSVQIVGFSALMLLFSALLVGTITATRGSPLDRFMTMSWLRALGRYSYAMYVFHWPIIVTLRANDTIVNSLPTLGGSLLPGRFVLAAISFVVSFVVAWLCWHFLEKHVLQLKDYFPYHDREPRSTPNPRIAESEPLPHPPPSNL